MIPIENVETLNRRLKESYGLTNDLPNFRIVWSEDQWEMRETEYTNEGFQLLYPEVRNLPKYKQYIHEKFLLERLTVVPNFQVRELGGSELSYECIWVFEDSKGNPLRPVWPAARFVIDQIHKAIEEKTTYTKYKDPMAGLNTKQLLEKKHEEITILEQILFEGETDIGDSLAYKEGVGFTTSKIKEN